MVRWLGAVERRFPVLAREISSIDVSADGTARIRLSHTEGVLVIGPTTPLDKIALVDDVLRDLKEKGIGYREVDLRFDEQIVVRRG